MRALSRFAAVAALGVSTMLAQPVRADGAVARCQVRMIDAFHQPGGLDPRITVLRPYLTQPPFTAWQSFRLVEDKDIEVAHQTTQRFALPNGNQASLTFLEHLRAPDGKHRMRLRLEVDRGARKVLDTTFILDEGGVVLQAGQKHGKALLILSFSCAIPNG